MLRYNKLLNQRFLIFNEPNKVLGGQEILQTYFLLDLWMDGLLRV